MQPMHEGYAELGSKLKAANGIHGPRPTPFNSNKKAGSHVTQAPSKSKSSQQAQKQNKPTKNNKQSVRQEVDAPKPKLSSTTSKEKSVTEKEVFRVMQRLQKELYEKAMAGENVDIFARQVSIQPCHAKGESSTSAMEIVLEADTAKPPDPGTALSMMDEQNKSDHKSDHCLSLGAFLSTPSVYYVFLNLELSWGGRTFFSGSNS